jgi:hypothetical protein
VDLENIYKNTLFSPTTLVDLENIYKNTLFSPTTLVDLENMLKKTCGGNRPETMRKYSTE